VWLSADVPIVEAASMASLRVAYSCPVEAIFATLFPDGETVTVHSAFLPPSAVVTIIVAVPAARALTVPFVTAATEGSLEVQLTA